MTLSYGRKSLVKAERERCANILTKYKAELLHKLMNDPLSPKQKTYLRRVIKLLHDINNEILQIEKPTEIPIAAGEFSTDEMERALAIIEEQNANPFDGG